MKLTGIPSRIAKKTARERQFQEVLNVKPGAWKMHLVGSGNAQLKKPIAVTRHAAIMRHASSNKLGIVREHFALMSGLPCGARDSHMEGICTSCGRWARNLKDIDARP